MYLFHEYSCIEINQQINKALELLYLTADSCDSLAETDTGAIRVDLI